MKISFAATRPAGDYALVIPSAGDKRPGLASVGDGSKGVEAAIKRQRFEGDASAAVEHFLDGGQRVLVVGTGASSKPDDAAEKLGGMAVSRLLLSGETHAVIDLTGLDYDADAAARVALAAALRAWRYDRYKTRLKDKQKPTLTQVTIVGSGDGAKAAWDKRYSAVYEGASLTRELVTEPANIIYPQSFVERVIASVEGSGLEVEVIDGPAMVEHCRAIELPVVVVDQAADEAEAVGMHAGAGKSQDDVARLDFLARQRLRPIDRADTEAGEVVIALGIHPRHLGRFATD